MTVNRPLSGLPGSTGGHPVSLRQWTLQHDPGPGWTPCLPIYCSSIVIELSSCNRRVSKWYAYLKMLMRRLLSYYIRFLYTIATRLFIRDDPNGSHFNSYLKSYKNSDTHKKHNVTADITKEVKAFLAQLINAAHK